MKITLVPNTSNFYDRRQLQNLAATFREKGFEAVTLDTPITSHPNASGIELKDSENRTQEKYENIKTDVLLEVNRLRNKKLNKKTRHICWFQDLKPSEAKPFLEYAENKNPQDLIYLLGEKEHYGLSNSKAQIGSLLTGLTRKECENNSTRGTSRRIDVNLLGYFPQINKITKTKELSSQNKEILKEILRRPRLLLEILFGRKWHINLKSFEKTDFFQKTHAHIEKHYKPLTGTMISWQSIQPNNFVDTLIYDLLYVEQPRWIDRIALFNILKKLSEDGRKILIAGKNWQTAFPGHDFIRNHIKNPVEIFSDSKITLHNNTHGIGIHSRVLEAMASGSFVIMHSSPHSLLPGGMDSSFEPDLHYGRYTEDNLAAKVEYWLAHDSERQNAIQECRKILLSQHLWQHRASQILEDLA